MNVAHRAAFMEVDIPRSGRRASEAVRSQHTLWEANIHYISLTCWKILNWEDDTMAVIKVKDNNGK